MRIIKELELGMVKILYKKNIQYILFGAFLFLIGCDEEVPFPTVHEGEIVFRADAQLDNDALELEAGKDNFYMYTDYELNEQQILEFSGAFQKNDLCLDVCDEKLKIIINNYQEGLNFVLDSAIYVGDYNLEPTIVTGNTQYFIDFSPVVNNINPVSYLWDFGDGTTSPLPNPPTHLFSSNNNYAVELIVNTQNGDNSRYRDSIDFSLPSSNCAFGLNYNITFDTLQNHQYTIIIVDTTASPQTTYLWEVNFFNADTTLNFNNLNAVTFAVPSSLNNFEVCVQKTTPNQCYTQFCKSFDNSGTNNYDLSFSYNIQNIVIPGDTTFFSMVTIEYTTPDGVFYSSKLGSQTGSTFEILNILDHNNNERDQTTKKIEAAVNCKLYNQDGSSLDFISNELIFGISIPE